MNLNERIKEERERLGYSQTAFAALAEASKHSQINWEKGIGTPTASVLAAWAPHGVDVLYILTGQRQAQTGVTLTPRQAAHLLRIQRGNAHIKDFIARSAQPLAIARRNVSRGGFGLHNALLRGC